VVFVLTALLLLRVLLLLFRTLLLFCACGLLLLGLSHAAKNQIKNKNKEN